MRSRISELWACYWLAGGIVVMLAYHYQHLGPHWRTIYHWARQFAWVYGEGFR